MILIDRAREMIKNQEPNRTGNYKKCYFVTIDGKDYALLVYECNNQEENNIRLQATNDLCEQGLSTPHAIGVDYQDGMAYELQERVHGKTMAHRNSNVPGGYDKYISDFIYTLIILDNATKDVFLRLLRDARIVHTNGYPLDCHPDNYLISKDGSITFLDLDIYREPTSTPDKFGMYVNILPYIISFVTSHELKPEGRYYDDACELLRRIGHKWFEICVEYLSLLDLSFEEVKNIINMIDFDYFMISTEDKNKMIDDYFKDDRIVLD